MLIYSKHDSSATHVFISSEVNRNASASIFDVIDANRKELVWQGRGVGTLNNIKNIEKKEQRIKEFVAQILEEYPPQMSVASN